MTQRAAAQRAGVSRGWWKRVEAADLAVGEKTLLDMLEAVGVRPIHLHQIGHQDLAGQLARREAFARDASLDRNLEDYLHAAPADPVTRDALVLLARALAAIREESESGDYVSPPAE